MTVGPAVRLRLKNTSTTKILKKVKGNVGPNPAPMEKQANLAPAGEPLDYTDWPPASATTNIWVRTWYGDSPQDFRQTTISGIDAPGGVDYVEVTLLDDACNVMMEIHYVDSSGQQQERDVTA